MRIFITGVACVGKTTIGEKLAVLLGYQFFDLDKEIERFFGAPIPRLRQRFLTQYSFHVEAAKALKHVLSRKDSRDCVIALPPGGLMDAYWRVVKTVKAAIVVLQDTPENILKRITFYDDDSHLVNKTLTDREKRHYLREIKADMTYFGRTYRRANLTVDIAGLGPEDAAQKVKQVLTRSLLIGPAGQPEEQSRVSPEKAPAGHAE
jgi:shikimate kinase